MMNLYGDDRYVYANDNRYKKPKFIDRLSDLLGYLNPVYYTETIARIHAVKKIEKDIANVDIRDVEGLISIKNRIFAKELESAEFGKAISKKSIEAFVAKVVLNNKNILSESDIDYLLVARQKANEEILKIRNENKLSGKIKGKIKQSFENTILYKSIVAKKLTSEINSVETSDTLKLKEIYETMVKYDFDSYQFGKYLSSKTLKTFVDKVETNEDNIVSESSLKFIKSTYEKPIEDKNEKLF